MASKEEEERGSFSEASSVKDMDSKTGRMVFISYLYGEPGMIMKFLPGSCQVAGTKH